MGLHLCPPRGDVNALEASFIIWFRATATPFPWVQQRLDSYSEPPGCRRLVDYRFAAQTLVERAYADAPWMPRVNLIGSQMHRGFGGRVLSVRCLGREKGGATGAASGRTAAFIQRL